MAHTMKKGLESRIHKETLKINVGEKQNRKVDRRVNRHLMEGETQMANKRIRILNLRPQ